MKSPLSVKTFSAVYKQNADGLEPPAVHGPTIAQQISLWLDENDVMPVAMDCEFTESNIVDNTVEYIHIAVVVFTDREAWESQQARIMASALALRELEKPDDKNLAKKRD